MIPIDCKITIFSLYLFVAYHDYFLARTQLLLISGKPISQYALYSLIFSSLRSIINGEQHEKYLYNQSSHYGKYEMFNRLSVNLIYWFKVVVSLDHDASPCFVSFLALLTCWATLQAENNIRSAPASSALTLISHWSHNAHTTNHHLCGSWEKNGVQR